MEGSHQLWSSKTQGGEPTPKIIQALKSMELKIQARRQVVL
jgi:hypothetical protein